MFEKLINEHGSAKILKERIALFKDKNASLEQKVAELQSENETLKNENDQLRKQLQNFNNGEPPEREEIVVDGPKTKILVFLADALEARADSIAGATEMKQATVEYHLAELIDALMVDERYQPLGPNTFCLEQAGRKYLVENGLL